MTETPDCLGLPSAVTKHSNKQQRKSEAVHLAHSFRLHPAMAGKSQLGVGVGGHSMREPIATHSEAENDKKKNSRVNSPHFHTVLNPWPRETVPPTAGRSSRTS